MKLSQNPKRTEVFALASFGYLLMLVLSLLTICLYVTSFASLGISTGSAVCLLIALIGLGVTKWAYNRQYHRILLASLIPLATIPLILFALIAWQ